jgi:hypothetical protein
MATGQSVTKITKARSVKWLKTALYLCSGKFYRAFADMTAHYLIDQLSKNLFIAPLARLESWRPNQDLLPL